MIEGPITSNMIQSYSDSKVCNFTFDWMLHPNHPIPQFFFFLEIFQLRWCRDVLWDEAPTVANVDDEDVSPEIYLGTSAGRVIRNPFGICWLVKISEFFRTFLIKPRGTLYNDI